MVKIDEHDIGKSKIQILTDLIYESTGLRFPESKIKYGKPEELDTRPDLWDDPNTFIPVKIDVTYDDRFTLSDGFMYRRHGIAYYLNKYNVKVNALQAGMRVHEIVEQQINYQIPFPLDTEDFQDYVITDTTVTSLKIKARSDSLLWHGVSSVPISSVAYSPLYTNLHLSGFREYIPS